MRLKLLLIIFTLSIQFRIISNQRQWVPPTTTAAEMWNPYTWYWPYAIAAAEGYRDYFQNAQQITNQLYTQAYATNAFWWTNRPGIGGGIAGGPAGQVGGAAGQIGGAAGQAGGAVGQVGNQAESGPVANMAQGGTGWN